MSQRGRLGAFSLGDAFKSLLWCGKCGCGQSLHGDHTNEQQGPLDAAATRVWLSPAWQELHMNLLLPGSHHSTTTPVWAAAAHERATQLYLCMPACVHAWLRDRRSISTSLNGSSHASSLLSCHVCVPCASFQLAHQQEVARYGHLKTSEELQSMLAALQKEVDTNAGHARKAAVSGKQSHRPGRTRWGMCWQPCHTSKLGQLLCWLLWSVESSKPLLLLCAQACTSLCMQQCAARNAAVAAVVACQTREPLVCCCVAGGVWRC